MLRMQGRRVGNERQACWERAGGESGTDAYLCGQRVSGTSEPVLYITKVNILVQWCKPDQTG